METRKKAYCAKELHSAELRSSGLYRGESYSSETYRSESYRSESYSSESYRSETCRPELYRSELYPSESESGNAVLNGGKFENYEKPEFKVFELCCEGIICGSISNTGVGGRVSDPEMGEEASWPGFDSGRGF